MSPKGLTFVRCVAGSTTSLAVRSVALWAKDTLIGSGLTFSIKQVFIFNNVIHLKASLQFIFILHLRTSNNKIQQV